jgi:uncharacterized membrane protein
MQKRIQWLLSQLPDLQKEGVLDEATANRLRQHYQPQLTKQGPNTALLLTSILGALLIGTGIISIFAYNWESLSRPVRVVLSLLPLLIAQGLYVFTFYRKADSPPWTESTAAFLLLMLGAAIALISQTYHIPGTMEGYLKTWMILSIPLLFLTRSTLVTILYLAGITGWLMAVKEDFGESSGRELGYWLFFLAVVPHLWQELKDRSPSIRGNLLGWATAISLSIAVGLLVEWDVDTQVLLAYGTLFGSLYVLGRWVYGQGEYFWYRPWQTAAIAGVYVMSLILAYEWHFEPDTWAKTLHGEDFPRWAALTNAGLGILGLLGTAFAAWWLPKQGTRLNYVLVAYPLLVIVGILFGQADLATVSMILFNAYLFGLGVLYLWRGLQYNALGLVNAGMLFIASLLVMRFFDSNISFVVKGIVFILIGLGFFAVNFILIRKRKNLPDHV